MATAIDTSSSSNYPYWSYDEKCSPSKVKLAQIFDVYDQFVPTKVSVYLKITGDFVDYFDGDFKSKLVSGYMGFEVIDGELFTITEYRINSKLTEKELFQLADYTQGQWSDGIGENFEQNPCKEINEEEVYISPWQRNQSVLIQQIID